MAMRYVDDEEAALAAMGFVSGTKAIDIDCRYCKASAGEQCTADELDDALCIGRIIDAMAVTRDANKPIRNKLSGR